MRAGPGAARCAELLHSPCMMNGKSLSAETQARGLTLHPDVREGSLDRLVRCVSLCGELCVQKREIFYLIPL